MKDKSIKQYLFLFLSIFLAGCSDPAMEEFERLCAEEAEEKIGEPIEVDGFFFASEDDCATCRIRLPPRGNYKYIEWFNTEKSRNMGELKLNQYYRMYQAPKDNPYCNWMVAKTKDRDDVDFCIVTEPVTKVISTYGFRHEIVMKAKFNDAEIWEHYKEIYEISGAVISNEKKYRLFSNVNSAFNPASHINCKDNVGVKFHGNLLKPKE